MQNSNITRRDFVKIGGAALANTCLLSQTEAQGKGNPSKTRPNIVFVFSDEHRWSSLPFTEMPEVVAPNMARLAQQGTRFDNCCSTSPICTPYRGMLLTGQWPHKSSCVSNDTFIDSNAIGINFPTIADTFKQSGYKTGYVGKWHLKDETVYNAGFDYFKHWLYGDEHWETEVRDVPSKESFKTVHGYNAIGMTDQAIEFIEHTMAEGDDPFMLMLSLNPPHWRWDDSPEEFYNLYPKDKITLRPNVTDDRVRSGKFFEYYQHYHGHISAVDRELGRVMKALEDANIADNTILIYTSDHGSSFGSNGVFNKGNPYEESVRVPFIARWPGKVKANHIADHNLGTIDLYPTLCGLAGINAPESCPGLDFSPAFLGEPSPDPKSQLLLVNNYERNFYKSQLLGDEKRHDYNPFRGVRTKRHTYAVDRHGDWILYDNKSDPFQQENLIDSPKHKKLRNELRTELDNWLAKAELPYIPDEWKQLSLPKRIKLENQHYSLINHQEQWERYIADQLKPFLAQASNPAQKEKLEKAGTRIFNTEFFSQYRALYSELHANKRTELPDNLLQEKMHDLENHHAQRLKVLADQILEV
ncbi:sulfatase [Puniceicoccaceae bacterium K14]|nr:sulfatase [Puniceicoccaceae bacterium K14]